MKLHRLSVFTVLAIALSAFAVGFISSSASSVDDDVTNSLGQVDSVRRLSLPTNDIIFNALDNKLYASVPGSAGSIGNSITRVNPFTGTVEGSIFIGSEPTKLAINGDGQTLYTYLSGAYSISRYNMATQAVTGNYWVTANPANGLVVATDIAVSPDDANVVAVARTIQGGSQLGVAIYNNGVQLPQTTPGNSLGSDYLGFSDSGAQLFGTGPSSGLRRMIVSATGVVVDQVSSAAGSPFKYSNGKLFILGGSVVDAGSLSLLGTCPNASGAVVTPETSVNRAYYVTQETTNSWVLRACDTNSFTQVGTLPIPNLNGFPSSLVRWGTNGLALRTTGGQLVLIQTSLIPTPDPIPLPSPTPTITPTPTPTPFNAAVREIVLPNNDIVYRASNQKIYATVPSSEGPTRGNSLTEVDPLTESIGASFHIGSEPSQIAMTDDGSALYIGVNGSGAIRRYDFATSTVGPLISLGVGSNGPNVAHDIDVVPGSNDSVAVSRSSGFQTAEISIFDNAVRRPALGTGQVFIDFSTPTVLFSGGTSTFFHAVGPGGITQSGPSMLANQNSGIKVIGNRIYSGNGRVLDTGLASVAGTYAGLGFDSTGAFDVENNRAFFVTNESGSTTLRAYELDTFRFIGSVPLPVLNGVTPLGLLRWGTNGLAFRTGTNRIFIIQTNLVTGGAPVPTPSPTPTITPTPTPVPPTTFVRRIDVPANDLIVHAGNTVIASVADVAGNPLANTMTHINPSNGQVLSSIPIGTEPSRIAASDDGQTLWTRLNTANAVRRYNLQTQTAGLQFALPVAFQSVQDMAVVPGSPAALAVAARSSGVAIFDDGVQRPNATNGGASAINSIEFSSDPSILYGYNSETSAFGLAKFMVSPTGVSGTVLASNLVSGFGTQIKYHNGLLYTSNGRVIDPVTLTVLGTFNGGGSTFEIDPANNRIFFLSGSGLQAFDLQTYVRLGSLTIQGYSGTPTSLSRWGSNGLVFRAPLSSAPSESHIYLVQSALVASGPPIPTGFRLTSDTIGGGSENVSNINIAVTRTGETSTTGSVDYATSDITAVAGLDYIARSGTLVFAPGEVTKVVSVPVINDNVFEPLETFKLELSNPAGPNTFVVHPSSATVFIADNDFRPNVSTVNASVLEPTIGNTTTVNVQVQLTNPSYQTITVNYATANATATAGADYVAASGQITFAPFETVKSIPIQVLADLVTEPNETFTVSLSSPVNTSISGGPATVTIRNLNHAAHVFDFEGDGKTDIGIFRPADGTWWINRSSTGVTFALQFGAATDRIAPADYTGDGKTDIAFFRPSDGNWFILRSEDDSFYSFPFGTSGDIPVPADYDNDGKADPAVFRPSTGVWFIQRSSDNGTTIQQFGSSGDIPVAADYDGDGRADLAIFRPADGTWWLNRSTAGVIVYQFGESSDKLVPGDYTGDGRTDVAFWRPSNGFWFVLRSEDSSFFSAPFGTNGDIPAPGDFDGDGKFDLTVFRPSEANWYSQRSTAGTLIRQFGAAGDRPVPNAFIP